MRIGILAIQGDFKAHAEAIESYGHPTIEVKHDKHLEDIDALILPGGESTTMLKLLNPKLEQGIIEFSQANKGILATCAGLILIANKVRGPEQKSLNLLPLTIERNAYGRQIDSFITDEIKFKDPESKEDPILIPGTFIRAPKIIDNDSKIEIWGKLKGEPVLVRYKKIIACSFHPELSYKESTNLYNFIFRTWFIGP